MKFPIIVVCVLFAGRLLAQQPIKVLIVDGYSNHDWKQTTNMVRMILENTGRFKVDVSTAPGTPGDTDTWNPEFDRYDVVIQNTNNIQNPSLRWPRRVQAALEKYVRGGGGLYILHSANNAFPDWPEYNKMIGLGWRSKETGYALQLDSSYHVIRIPPGEGEGTNHGARFDAVIHILKRHPINQGYPDDWKTASMELYRYARGPAENLTILSAATDSVTGKRWPVEWVVNYGKGRVYVSSMGHLWKGDTLPVSYRCIGFQTTLIRATEWLATGKVTYPVPANFPTKDHISLATRWYRPTAVPDSWTQDFPPFRIAGNLYYVGSAELTSYLITTPEGHILINTGIDGSDSLIRRHVEALGFHYTDIKILLTNQCHYDHVGAMAAVKKATGAQLMIEAEDAPLMADGGYSDCTMGGKGRLFEPVTVDRLLHDGDDIRLGGMTLTVLHHPGHTKGACSYYFTVKDSSRSYRVLIANMPTILSEMTFPHMACYPGIGRDYAHTLDTMPKIQFDIFLAAHAGQFDLEKKYRPGYHPTAYFDRKLYIRSLDELKAEYLKKER